MDANIQKEIVKNKSEELLNKADLERSKRQFIEYIKNVGGVEIKNNDNSYYTKPIKYNKPLKVKLKELLYRIKKVLNIF